MSFEQGPREGKETNSSEWESLGTVEFAGGEIRRMTRAEWLEENRGAIRDEIKMWAGEVHDIDTAFGRYLDRLDEEGRELTETEFLKWEDDFSFSYGRMEDGIKKAAWDDGAQTSIEEVAAATAGMVRRDESRFSKTVEATAGRFYQERSAALEEAIRARGGEAEEADLKELAGFYASVGLHLEYKHMTPEEIQDEYGDDAYGFHRYDRQRTAAHNEAIKHLNRLNALARKYGTRPFMPRDLWTSENQNQTEEMKDRMRYDRRLFERYYEQAFSGLDERVQRRHLRSSGSFY